MSGRDSYLVGTRVIDHETCTQGASGAWYPDFGHGVEIFGWAHEHPDAERTAAEIVAYIAAGLPMHLLTNAELRLADAALVPEWVVA